MPHTCGSLSNILWISGTGICSLFAASRRKDTEQIQLICIRHFVKLFLLWAEKSIKQVSSSVTACGLYSGSVRFEFRPGHRLFGPRFIVAFLSTFSKFRHNTLNDATTSSICIHLSSSFGFIQPLDSTEATWLAPHLHLVSI